MGTSIRVGREARAAGTLWHLPRLPASRLVMAFLGAVLLAAAAAKSYELFSGEPSAETGLFGQHWFRVALIEVELVMGVWFLSGGYGRAAWWSALGLFSSFAVVSAWRGWTGETSCGCFGSLPMSPWSAVAMDLSALLALVACPPPKRVSEDGFAGDSRSIDRSVPLAGHSPRGRLIVSGCLGLGILAAAAGAMLSRAELTEDGVIRGPGRLVVLEPEKWVGKRFPLIPYIDGGGFLAKGHWTLLLYRYDCPKCLRLLSRLADHYRWTAGKPLPTRRALVELPTKTVVPMNVRIPGARNVTLVDAWRWAAPTPTVMVVRDGVVLHSDASDTAIESLFMAQTDFSKRNRPSREPFATLLEPRMPHTDGVVSPATRVRLCRFP